MLAIGRTPFSRIHETASQSPNNGDIFLDRLPTSPGLSRLGNQSHQASSSELANQRTTQLANACHAPRPSLSAPNSSQEAKLMPHEPPKQCSSTPSPRGRTMDTPHRPFISRLPSAAKLLRQAGYLQLRTLHQPHSYPPKKTHS